MSFKLLNSHGASRHGVVKTIHGDIKTPAFMPVGTRAAVKGVLPEALDKTSSDILLCNTYHLMLRPTAELISELGGLHKFMNWSKPILTDSGGFQVMSLSSLRKVYEDGVKFRSHIDGSAHFLSPERSIEIQHLLDSTITMAFDECTEYPASIERVQSSMELSMRWAKRSKEKYVQREGYSIFGIVQGGVYQGLRKQSAQMLQEIGFDGYAIGGLAVGEGHEKMCEVLDFTVELLPNDKPRYLMGVGKPKDILESVKRGVDMFDCVMPTRSGRNSQAFTRDGTINIRNAKYADDPSPIDQQCSCYTCKNYSRAYIHHMVRVGEINGPMLMTLHNINFYQDFMAKIREAIEAGKDLEAHLSEFAGSL